MPTEWVLIDIRIELVTRGFGHGTVYLWAPDGTLMATASQSAIVREFKPMTAVPHPIARSTTSERQDRR